MHQLANAAMTPPIAAMVQIVNELMRTGPVALASIGENLFLNRELLRLDATSFESAQTLGALFKRLGLHEVSFTQELTEPALREFLATYQKCLHGAAAGALAKESFEGIKIRVLDKAEQDAYGAKEIDERQNVLKHYVALAMAIKEASDLLNVGRAARYARLRRAVHALSDAAQGHAGLLVGITRFPTLRGEAHFHLATVASFCLLMGRRLKLPRPVLSNLGLAALLHDLARLDLPEVGSSAAELEALGAEAAKVPLRTVLKACAGGFSAGVLTLATVAGEQALRADSPDAPSVFARLIAVPCAFDRLTNPSPPGRPLPPDQALRLILDRAPGRFDDRGARLFAALVGLFPVGTTVKLSNGDLAVVLEAPTDPSRLAQPRVKVVQTRSGAADYVLDLADPGAKVQIACCVEPEQSTVNVPQLLLA